MEKISHTFGQNLKKLMFSNGMTYTELAKRIDVSVASISNWIAGKQMPRESKIEKLCLLFSVSYDELVGEPKPDKPAPSIVIEHTSDEDMLINRYKRLDEYAKHLIRMVIDAEYYRCINQDKKE